MIDIKAKNKGLYIRIRNAFFLIRSYIYKTFNRIRGNSRFILDYFRFKRFLKNQKKDSSIKNITNERICITVIPWLGSAIPWFAITIALLLSKRGKNIFILFVDMPFGDDKLFHKIQSRLIFKILKNIPIRLVKLSNYNNFDNYYPEVNYLSKLNSLHGTHGETNQVLRKSYEQIIENQLMNIYSKASDFYKKEKFNQIILPGGIWGPSSVIMLHAKKNNKQLITYDSDENQLIMSTQGVATQLNDIRYSFDKLQEDEKQSEFAIAQGMRQLQKRREGKDTWSYFEITPDYEDFNNDYYLMLLNSVWDSAALGLHAVYESMIEWIFDSIDWVLKNTEKTIIIRQHPAERDKQIDNTDSYAEKIQDRFGKNKRVRFIEANRDINTYDLIENASCILGFSSTIIVESVMLGKPAIIVANTYFSNFNIVYNANNKKEYYMYLLKAAASKLTITQGMIDRACISNYLTQSCNNYKTEFTPVRKNYLKWSKRTLDELEKDYLPLQAILRNIPLSTLNHEKIFNDTE